MVQISLNLIIGLWQFKYHVHKSDLFNFVGFPYLIEQMVVQSLGPCQTGDSFSHLRVFWFAEPDWRCLRICLGYVGVNHMLPAGHVNELAGELVHRGGDNLQSDIMMLWNICIRDFYVYLSWVFGKEASIALISVLRTLRQAILAVWFTYRWKILMGCLWIKNTKLYSNDLENSAKYVTQRWKHPNKSKFCCRKIQSPSP